MIRVSPSGADLSDTRPPATLTESAKLNAGYIGSLYPGKGMEIIVELAKRCEWADFHIVGGLPEDIRHWESRASALTNVHFYGFVPHQEARRYQRAMDVLLLPNQRQVSTAGRGTLDIGQWTSPLKLFEYMAAAKPIVSTDLPVLREVLAHQVTAYLCPPDDVEAWVDALKHLRDHPAERARLGQAAGSAFTANYSWKARALKILDGIETTGGLETVATGLRWQNARLKPHTVEKAREPRIEGFRAQVNVGSVFVANPAQDVLRLVFPGRREPAASLVLPPARRSWCRAGSRDGASSTTPCSRAPRILDHFVPHVIDRGATG